MSADTRPCPKCERTMHIGFVPDMNYGGTAVATWAEGKPRKSFWQGTIVDKDASIAIDAYRCEGCGYVELYATDRSQAN